MNEAELEAREIAQLRRKLRKAEARNAALKEQNTRLIESTQHQNKKYPWQRPAEQGDSWESYYQLLAKVRRQEKALTDIYCSLHGSKHWAPSYIIEEYQSLEEALEDAN